MIKVCNKRNDGADLIPGAPTFYVGRPSPLGNMYSHIQGRGILCSTREEAVKSYRNNFLRLLHNNQPAHIMFQDICKAAKQGDVNLVCWCAPLACHADIIKEQVEKYNGLQ